MIVEVYTDGGVIAKNPSEIGGTWAYCFVNAHGERVKEAFGFIPCPDGREITNNHMEQIALVLALENLPDGYSGKVCSDSMVALGRVFLGWRERNLPANVSERTRRAVSRMGKIETVLLQGHPTKKDLIAGIGKKRGYPVSAFNVWCDEACKLAGLSRAQIPGGKVSYTVERSHAGAEVLA